MRIINFLYVGARVDDIITVESVMLAEGPVKINGVEYVIRQRLACPEYVVEDGWCIQVTYRWSVLTKAQHHTETYG